MKFNTKLLDPEELVHYSPSDYSFDMYIKYRGGQQYSITIFIN